MDTIVQQIIELLSVQAPEAEMIFKKAIEGGELNILTPTEWFEQRFKPRVVWISEDNYAHMCVDALKIAGKVAATDFGSSRQRDLGQIWADMTRGYLGEQALLEFLKQRFGIQGTVGHEAGSLEEYLPMDVQTVSVNNEAPRPLRIKIGVKTIKWNGIWFDIPGAQFVHSNIHVLVKVGVSRDHLFAFLKSLSAFKDKVLQKGIDVGAINEAEAQQLYDQLPSFAPVPAYICGFVDSADTYQPLTYTGARGRLHYTIDSWNGPIHDGDLATIKTREVLPDKGKVQFVGIGSFSHPNGYLFNMGHLKWSDADWQSVIDRI